MNTLLRRLRRAWAQSRIRLPLRPLAPEDLAPGDRVRIGSRTWRIAALCAAEGGRPVGARLEEEPPGSGRALLHGPFPEGVAGQGSWLLSENGDSLPVPAGALLVFPAGGRTMGDSEPRRWS